jgi:hypothetical protein
LEAQVIESWRLLPTAQFHVEDHLPEKIDAESVPFREMPEALCEDDVIVVAELFAVNEGVPLLPKLAVTSAKAPAIWVRRIAAMAKSEVFILAKIEESFVEHDRVGGFPKNHRFPI